MASNADKTFSMARKYMIETLEDASNHVDDHYDVFEDGPTIDTSKLTVEALLASPSTQRMLKKFASEVIGTLQHLEACQAADAAAKKNNR